MKYLLDTNICIYIIKNNPKEVVDIFKSHPISSICISSITLSELEFGIEKSSNIERNRIALTKFLAPIDICHYDSRASMCYGKIRAYLEKRGNPIGPLDTLIAAHCLSLNYTLVTNNEKEFSRIPNLRIANWVDF